MWARAESAIFLGHQKYLLKVRSHDMLGMNSFTFRTKRFICLLIIFFLYRCEHPGVSETLFQAVFTPPLSLPLHPLPALPVALFTLFYRYYLADSGQAVSQAPRSLMGSERL